MLQSLPGTHHLKVTDPREMERKLEQERTLSIETRFRQGLSLPKIGPSQFTLMRDKKSGERVNPYEKDSSINHSDTVLLDISIRVTGDGATVGEGGVEIPTRIYHQFELEDTVFDLKHQLHKSNCIPAAAQSFYLLPASPDGAPYTQEQIDTLKPKNLDLMVNCVAIASYLPRPYSRFGSTPSFNARRSHRKSSSAGMKFVATGHGVGKLVSKAVLSQQRMQLLLLIRSVQALSGSCLGLSTYL